MLHRGNVLTGLLIILLTLMGITIAENKGKQTIVICRLLQEYLSTEIDDMWWMMLVKDMSDSWNFILTLFLMALLLSTSNLTSKCILLNLRYYFSSFKKPYENHFCLKSRNISQRDSNLIRFIKLHLRNWLIKN